MPVASRDAARSAALGQRPGAYGEGGGGHGGSGGGKRKRHAAEPSSSRRCGVEELNGGVTGVEIDEDALKEVQESLFRSYLTKRADLPSRSQSFA